MPEDDQQTQRTQQLLVQPTNRRHRDHAQTDSPQHLQEQKVRITVRPDQVVEHQFDKDNHQAALAQKRAGRAVYARGRVGVQPG